MSSAGADRYNVKAAAGWSRTRADGSSYSAETDDIAEKAERWFAEKYGGRHDDRVGLHGDCGFDVALPRRGCTLRVDVIHAGMMPDGTARRGGNVIVNLSHNKLIRSDVLVYVEGPPFEAIGWIYTRRFVSLAQVKDYGFGQKLGLPVSALFSMGAFV